MSRCPRVVLIAGIVSMPALWLYAGGEACAQQLNLVNTKGIDFGRFVPGTGGTVVVDVSGARTRTGGVILLNSQSAGPATFNVSRSGNGNNSNKAVIITLPANGSALLTSGSNSMAVNAFVSSPSTLNSLPASGAVLTVGADLTVAANQAAGAYTGSFSVIVNFQ